MARSLTHHEAAHVALSEGDMPGGRTTGEGWRDRSRIERRRKRPKPAADGRVETRRVRLTVVRPLLSDTEEGDSAAVGWRRGGGKSRSRRR